MNTMRKLVAQLLLCVLGGGLLTACSSEEEMLQIPEGKGYVKLDLKTDLGFQTKVVDDHTTTKKKITR